LKALDETVTTMPGQRIVDEGNVMTSAGVAAGLDMALHIVEKLCGQSAARATAQYIEYIPQVPASPQ
jgi:transcriptional regulator GlxA family with amidase domain